MANPAEDRLDKILHQTTVTGIDYIFVYKDQKTLDVHFLRSLVQPSDPPSTLLATLTAEDIRIYNPSGEVPDIHVKPSLLPLIWNNDSSLRLNLMSSGDFTLYRLKINDLRVGLDSFYNDVTFDFKANCPSDLDCAPPAHQCPPEEPVDFPIDYLARDFWSFRTAILDFASLKYPDWTDRLEADAGIMMAEVMSALGDEMAYYQDRISREAYLETATQRRSFRHHARLVDYNVHDGLGASGWLDVQVDGTIAVPHLIPVGTDVWAVGDNGTKIDFEVGLGFAYNRKNDISAYNVDDKNNEFQPHIWDKNQICLPVGTTELYLDGDQTGSLKLDDFPTEPKNKVGGKWVLLKTQPTNPAQPIRKIMVRLIKIEPTEDKVLGGKLTHIVWEKEQALPFEFDMTSLVVRGNLIPVSAGKTYTKFFVIGAKITDLPATEQKSLIEMGLYDTIQAIEREGRDGTIRYLFSLPESESQPLVWLGSDPHKAAPEIQLKEVTYNSTKDCWEDKETWEWKNSFIGINSSQSQNTHYVLEDGSWRRVVGYQRIGEEFVHRDYASNRGTTIRFGDGEFGLTPAPKTVFRVDYRLGGGRQSNVTADSLTDFAADKQALHCDPSVADLSFIKTVTNPLNTENGIDAELPNDIRQSAPEAFRAVTYRAVRPEDYAEAAERLPWVQRAGAAFRWTGSWQTAFVTPDPLDRVTLEEPQRQSLVEQLDRFRQAGREAYTLDPIYADLDLEIEVCVAPSAYRGEVKERVWAALMGKNGFFKANNFTFGMPLERSVLETIIQNTEGVKAVENIKIRRRGWFDWEPFTDFNYPVGDNVIIRVENDLLHPNRGSLKLCMHGGA